MISEIGLAVSKIRINDIRCIRIRDKRNSNLYIRNRILIKNQLLLSVIGLPILEIELDISVIRISDLINDFSNCIDLIKTSINDISKWFNDIINTIFDITISSFDISK